MNITPNITAGMTPQEKESFFAHQEKRHREEAEKMELERERLKAYKESIINDILKHKPNAKREDLVKMTTRALERIW